MLLDWNPNTTPGFGVVEAEPCRIYGDEACSIFALVDAEDFSFLSRWRWSPKFSRGGNKFYLRRVEQKLFQPQFMCAHQGLVRIREQSTVFLHRVILERARGAPPDELKVVADHIDGNSLNCRRSNLRWVTHSENVRNKK